jgi:hypothetical protein
MSTKETTARYTDLLRLLGYATHELADGVLCGANGATPRQCAEWMSDLIEFEAIWIEFGRDQEPFIEDRRWHFEHYPHSLGRSRHFVDYRKYIEDRGGPLRVRNS